MACPPLTLGGEGGCGAGCGGGGSAATRSALPVPFTRARSFEESTPLSARIEASTAVLSGLAANSTRASSELLIVPFSASIRARTLAESSAPTAFHEVPKRTTKAITKGFICHFLRGYLLG